MNSLKDCRSHCRIRVTELENSPRICEDNLCPATAEDAGGLVSGKDDNMAGCELDRKDGAIFKFGDSIIKCDDTG